MRVLVAEDDEGLREVLVLGLSDAGYHVDAVDRGDDAIDQLRWYEYDVAVIDWRMPGAEGIDVVAWARKHDRPTALLMLTARDAPARPDPRPGHRRGRLPGQAVRLRGAARPGPRPAAAAARRGCPGPARGRWSWTPSRARSPRRAGAVAHRHRVPDPGAADAPLPGRRGPQGDRRARLGATRPSPSAPTPSTSR